MQTISTNTSSLKFYWPDALPEAQPRVSKHWRHHRTKSEVNDDCRIFSVMNASLPEAKQGNSSMNVFLRSLIPCRHYVSLLHTGLRHRTAWVQIAAAMLSGNNSLRQTVHTHHASIHQSAKLVAALLSVVRVTAGLAESNGRRPLGLWLTSPAGWLPKTGISSGTLRSVIEYGLPLRLVHNNWSTNFYGRLHHPRHLSPPWRVYWSRAFTVTCCPLRTSLQLQARSSKGDINPHHTHNSLGPAESTTQIVSQSHTHTPV